MIPFTGKRRILVAEICSVRLLSPEAGHHKLCVQPLLAAAHLPVYLVLIFITNPHVSLCYIITTRGSIIFMPYKESALPAKYTSLRYINTTAVERGDARTTPQITPTPSRAAWPRWRTLYFMHRNGTIHYSLWLLCSNLARYQPFNERREVIAYAWTIGILACIHLY